MERSGNANGRATILPVIDDGIPEELKRVAQWVAWKSIPDPKAPKPRKLPWQATGRDAASVSNASTWTTYDAAFGVAKDNWNAEFYIVNVTDEDTSMFSTAAWFCIQAASGSRRTSCLPRVSGGGVWAG